MDPKAVNPILLTVAILAAATRAFAHDGCATGEPGTVWVDEGSNDNGDYKVNVGYPVSNGGEERYVGNGYDGNYEGCSLCIRSYRGHGKSSVGQRESESNQGEGKHRGVRQSSAAIVGVGDGRKGDRIVKRDGSYNHDYKHSYHRSYGHRHHNRRLNGKGNDGIGDDYQGYHRVRFERNRDGGKDSGGGFARGGGNFDGYRYDDGFESHYGDNGKEQKERDHNGDSRRIGYDDDYGRGIEYRLRPDRNEGVDVHGAEYHRGHTESDGNYGKGYHSFASEHHYRRREQDYDRGDHRHGLDRRNR